MVIARPLILVSKGTIMQKAVRYSLFALSVTVFISIIQRQASADKGLAQWEDPFPRISVTLSDLPDTLTLQDALSLVAFTNPLLKAGNLSVQAAENEIVQAGAMSNPELEIEAEDVGGDRGGFGESEITALLSHEIEVWGQRGARREVARAQKLLGEFGARSDAYRIYAETKNRFYALSGAQQKLQLAQTDVEFAEQIVDAVRLRVEEGAAMESELFLAETGLERAKLELSAAEAHMTEAQLYLSTLWGEPRQDFCCVEDTFLAAIPESEILATAVKESKEAFEFRLIRSIMETELKLEKREWRPNPTFSGGFKRSEAEKVTSFVAGLSLPLPILNRNQSGAKAWGARTAAVTLKEEQARREAAARVRTALEKLGQLQTSLSALDRTIIPKSRLAYQSLRTAYQNGRIPLTQLLESERTLIEVRSQRLDLKKEFREQIVALEAFLGVRYDNLLTIGE